jgi:DNA-binding NtrC family response regulator
MADARAKQTILVLEDAVAIRGLVRIILEDAGYAVLEAGTVDEAARHIEGAAQRPHALICDVNIPGENSLAGVGRLQQIEPTLKVLYISGESVGTALPPGSSFLQKPFPPDALVKKIEGLLAG